MSYFSCSESAPSAREAEVTVDLSAVQQRQRVINEGALLKNHLSSAVDPVGQQRGRRQVLVHDELRRKRFQNGSNFGLE